MTDIIELIDHIKTNVAYDGSYRKFLDDINQLKFRISAMQEVCDKALKWKKDPMIYYTQLIDAIDKLEALKND